MATLTTRPRRHASARTPQIERRLSDSVYEQLLELILAGELPQGEPISEVRLAERLEVSRTPIREAIGQLVSDGLMTLESNRRPIVTEFSSDDVFEVYEMRRILESEAACMAATRIDRITLEQLQRDADEYAHAKPRSRTVTRWVELDDAFHSTIAQASGCRRLAQDIERYRRLHRAFNRTHTDVSILDRALDEHRDILTALTERDADSARSAMQAHLEEWQRFFASHLGRTSPGRQGWHR